jgi:hypothetical protein
MPAANVRSSAFPGNATMFGGSVRRYQRTVHDTEAPGSMIV